MAPITNERVQHSSIIRSLRTYLSVALCLDVLERLGEVTGHAGVGGAGEDARVLAGRRADLQE